MMGRLNQNQGKLFYSFCLDEVVPGDHRVREIAAVLDLSWVHAELAPHYSAIGRPSIDPVLMLRMLILGYAFAIRSERAICREVQVNLAYRWFCGLSIEDRIPDHSAFTRARNERFRDSDILRRVFERVVEACVAAGLVGAEGFAVDASLIVADANKQRSIPGSEWSKEQDPEAASRAVRDGGWWVTPAVGPIASGARTALKLSLGAAIRYALDTQDDEVNQRLLLGYYAYPLLSPRFNLGCPYLALRPPKLPGQQAGSPLLRSRHRQRKGPTGVGSARRTGITAA
jgi:transposase